MPAIASTEAVIQESMAASMALKQTMLTDLKLQRGIAAAADLCLRVPSNDTPRIREAHIMIGHILSEIAEGELFRR